jgi:hypothetical protein
VGGIEIHEEVVIGEVRKGEVRFRFPELLGGNDQVAAEGGRAVELAVIDVFRPRRQSRVGNQASEADTPAVELACNPLHGLIVFDAIELLFHSRRCVRFERCRFLLPLRFDLFGARGWSDGLRAIRVECLRARRSDEKQGKKTPEALHRLPGEHAGCHGATSTTGGPFAPRPMEEIA